MIAKLKASPQSFNRALGHHQLEELRKSHVDLFVAERLQTCEAVTVHEEGAVLPGR
jgi:hypothetical protein